ncbi:ATP-binding protein [Propionivibrio sp.]|uniref:ATP-binding protein n=1 Tax=Propionivibrio sp. TaxID=2212460 RepID=UPI002623DD1C|nr:ATP-binding protein [Propionivibrio sp.]
MTFLRKFVPQTLLVRTFLLVSLLIFVSVATWLTLFGLAEREPRARQLAQLTVSVVNLTSAALVAADPVKRLTLLRDLAESEGVHLYPAEASDVITALPDTYFFRVMYNTAKSQLGSNTRFAGSVNGQTGIWVSFFVGDSDGDDYWLMLPGEHAESDFPWHWLGWGSASLALALLVAWLIVSRVTLPLRTLAAVATEVGRGRHPDVMAERGAIELRQLAEAFNRMSKDLKRIDAERAEVLAGISHDLRTPLSRLRLEAEMSISGESARNGAIEDIEQMDAIIAQFLDYARDERGELAEPADVNALITQVASARGSTSSNPRISLGEVPRALIYRQALARALTNLLENARKYAGDQIAVETRIENGDILIDVLDRGPGIAESEMERLKRPFTRLENARTDASGTGLGLAIVERIARLHGGRLELLARQGGGLIARLRLPLKGDV